MKTWVIAGSGMCAAILGFGILGFSQTGRSAAPAVSSEAAAKKAPVPAATARAAVRPVSSQPVASAAVMPAAEQRAMVNKYCVGCHNQKLKSGGMALDQGDLAHPEQNAEIWEKAIRRIRAGMMPPLKSPRPEPAVLEALAGGMEASLDRAAALHPNLVPPGLHRVNRTEYANAVKDLLAVEIDPASFLPVDDASFGFDNVAGGLGVSPALVEGYMTAAAKISRLAMGHETAPSQKKYIAPQDYSQENHVEGLPLGTRGGMLINHYFAADGEYVISWFPVRGNTGELYGSNRRGEQLEVSIDGARAKVFKIDELPQGTDNDKNEVRVTLKAGMHKVGLAFLATTQVPIDDLNQHYVRSVLDTNPIPGYTFSPQVSQVIIMGPYNGARPTATASRDKILVCKPAQGTDEVPCAKKIISNLARKAFRRPVKDADVEDLLSAFQKGRNRGGFEEGVQMAVQMILADPEFVFRGEAIPATAKPGQPYRISDVELASRLAFFLWSAPPDDQLLTVAAQGKLRDPKVLERETLRMLASPKSKELVSNFTGQWLQLRNLASAAPITQLFPDFDDNLRQAFRTETEMFFDSVIREDRSVLDLLTADYTFVNERLAKHYGIPNIYGSHFRRVVLGPEFDVRRGLLGKGSIQLVTSVADRTSPVQRGKWVLLNVLGIIPPEPPPNVPPLKQSDKQANGQAVAVEQHMRERMEEHRSNPVCASCHLKMDPIGFMMENFDAVGKWRTKEFGKTLDVSGQLADGQAVTGPAGLRNGLMKYSPQFVRGVAEKLLTYALGRGVEYRDMPVVRSIARDASRNNYRFSSLVLGIVNSAPFQMNVAADEKIASR